MTGVIPEKLDGRQILTVYLLKEGRIKYHSFYCSFCGQKIGSVEGAKVYRLSDIDDISSYPTNPKLTLYCNGKFCRTYYKFVLR